MINSFSSGPFLTNAFLVVCDETKKAAIIDPAPDSAHAINQLIENEQLILEKILLTHTHWDHIADTAALKKKWNIPVYVHKADEANLIHPGSDKLPHVMTIEGVTPDNYLSEGDEITIGNIKLDVIHTPGHTPGGVCFYCKEKGFLISGDTLFKGSIGNLSFPTAEPDKMWESLQKLASLPPETKVYSGHGDATTIGAEDWLPQAKEIFEY